ncbi:MAG: hypothetical protein OEM51_01680 [Gammaproteobacteria bacterium]|nr:hypothetical protein [Gammaproteobacteria bacterium]
MGQNRKSHLTLDEIDAERPSYYLMGWQLTDLTEIGGYWSLVTKELLTFGECCKVYEKGLEPYEKFMTVSKVEFETLGIPDDRAASIYFDLDRQREVSIRGNSGKREKKQDG